MAYPALGYSLHLSLFAEYSLSPYLTMKPFLWPQLSRVQPTAPPDWWLQTKNPPNQDQLQSQAHSPTQSKNSSGNLNWPRGYCIAHLVAPPGWVAEWTETPEQGNKWVALHRAQPASSPKCGIEPVVLPSAWEHRQCLCPKRDTNREPCILKDAISWPIHKPKVCWLVKQIYYVWKKRLLTQMCRYQQKESTITKNWANMTPPRKPIKFQQKNLKKWRSTNCLTKNSE